MTIKEKIQEIIKIHTRVVTGVFLFMCLYLLWLPGDIKIRIIDILGVQIIGIISGIAYIPLITEKELSKTKMLSFNIIYCISINITVLLCGFFLKWFTFRNIPSVVGIEIIFIAVYTTMMIISYKIDNSQANKINKKLQERNREQDD